ncbi:MAG: DUF3489 domain-containing protein [Pseudomonadota bacterium]
MTDTIVSQDDKQTGPKRANTQPGVSKANGAATKSEVATQLTTNDQRPSRTGAASTDQREPKNVVLRRLLARKAGATVTALMSATGWQAHSVRAALSGLRKEGVAIERRKNRKGETVYISVVSDEPR